MKKFKTVLAIGLVACITFSTTACTASQEQTVLNDIKDVISFGEAIVTLLQGFGVLASPSQRQDVQNAAQYVAELTDASTQALTETNSTDSWDVKVKKIEALFSPIVVPTFEKCDPMDAGCQAFVSKLDGAVQFALAAVKTLMDQLHSQATLSAAHAADKSHSDLDWMTRRKVSSLLHKSEKVHGEAMAALSHAK